MILSNSRFPRKIQIETIEPKLGYVIPAAEKNNTHLYLREVYRQLKIAMEKHGNRKEALHFQAMEMYHLRHELKIGWDTLLLFLNYISNYHGASWSRGVIFTVVISFLSFVLYNEASGTPFVRWGGSENTDEGLHSALTGFTAYLISFPALNPESVPATSWQLNVIIFYREYL